MKLNSEKRHNQYDNLNFFLERTHEYQASGRHQTEEQAALVGDLIICTLDRLHIPFTVSLYSV